MKADDLETTMEPSFTMYIEQRPEFEALGDFTHRAGAGAIEKFCASYSGAVVAA